MNRDELVATVARKTQGTKDDPLTQGTIEKVVDQVIGELGLDPSNLAGADEPQDASEQIEGQQELGSAQND